MAASKKIAAIRIKAGAVSPTRRAKVAKKVARRQISRGRPGLTGQAKRKAVRRRVGKAFPFGYLDTV